MNQTHFYDNLNFEHKVTGVLNEDQINEIFKFYMSVESDIAKKAILLLLTDKKNNLDTKHNIDALYLLYLLLDKTNLRRELIEQLEDIILSGSCTQGRCYRLYQLFLISTA